MLHFGSHSLDVLPELRSVRFEGQENSSATSIIEGNIISSSTDFFGAVCCAPGNRVALDFPEEGLTFCDASHLTKEGQGFDSIYLPFIRYIDPTPLAVLFPSSEFMAEAAESAEHCADYCAISRDCRYFSYDSKSLVAVSGFLGRQ